MCDRFSIVDRVILEFCWCAHGHTKMPHVGIVDNADEHNVSSWVYNMGPICFGDPYCAGGTHGRHPDDTDLSETAWSDRAGSYL